MLSTCNLRHRVITVIVLLIGVCFIACGQLVRAADTVTFEIVADGMCCAGCAKTVAAKLYAAPGVIDVKANVATRTIVVTAKPSRNLTLEKLWSAAQKGKGNPSRLTAYGVVYTLVRPADLGPDEQPTAGLYEVCVSELRAHQSANQIANILHSRRGVAKVSLDATKDALIVEAAAGATLSPWMLMAAVQQASEQPVAISGPHGRLSIEPAVAASELSSRPVQQGETR